MLNLIEASLKERGLKVYRIDGQSSLSQRRKALETFGNEEEYSIMLASIGAAGEGYAIRCYLLSCVILLKARVSS